VRDDGQREPKRVVIDCFPESASAYRGAFAVVAVDVIRATTTAVTAAAGGRECFVVPTIEAATSLAEQLTDPLLVGELGGNMPYGFHLTNSPAELASRNDVHRPMILLSTSGTRLIAEAEGAEAVYVACLRNYTVQAAHLASHHRRVAVIGAGARGEFREEDQLCCAWIAEELVRAGYVPWDANTTEIIERWSGQGLDAITRGASADYLRRTDQLRDLEFIMAHVDDVSAVFRSEGGRVSQLAGAVPSVESSR
jgi:2-phosphosulfolactate phosphatase